MLRLAAFVGTVSIFVGCNTVNDRVTVHYRKQDEAIAKRRAESAAPQMQHSNDSTSYKLHVKGMGCPLCATNVRKAIERQPGVEAVNIDLGKGIVTVASRPNLEPTESDLRQAVANAGFELAKIERAQ